MHGRRLSVRVGSLIANPQRLAQLVLAVTLGLVAVALGASIAWHLASAPRMVTVQSLPVTVPLPLPPATVDRDTAAPARGVTGTAPLPALPMTAAAAEAVVVAERGIVAARPFAWGRATAVDRARALQCLTSAIYYEAASEPDIGQRAVAQVILNRARHPAFPATVCGVVFQGSERAGCQFSFACDGAMARPPARTAWTRALSVAGAALAGYVYRPVGLATHYHTFAVTPAWNRGLVMTDAIGAHFFHRWKGYWGTASAFRQSYQGGEPMPGPHARALPPPPATALGTADLATGSTIAPPPRGIDDVQDAWRDSGRAIAAPEVRAEPKRPAPAATPTPDDSQILPRWKDSGKPLDP